MERDSLPKVKDSQIDEAVKLIKEAQKPYIYVGGGAAGLGVSAVKVEDKRNHTRTEQTAIV